MHNRLVPNQMRRQLPTDHQIPTFQPSYGGRDSGNNKDDEPENEDGEQESEDDELESEGDELESEDDELESEDDELESEDDEQESEDDERESNDDEPESKNDEIMDDEVHTTENISQQTPSSFDMNNLMSSSTKGKARQKAMSKFHNVTVPTVLSEDEWMKVYDKDMKLTYRALYFNIIQKHRDEDDNAYIQRVNKIRTTLAEEADKVKKEYDVNFKINSLLSKPFVYDEQTLLEQSMREGSMHTHQPLKQKPMHMDDYR